MYGAVNSFTLEQKKFSMASRDIVNTRFSSLLTLQAVMDPALRFWGVQRLSKPFKFYQYAGAGDGGMGLWMSEAQPLLHICCFLQHPGN